MTTVDSQLLFKQTGCVVHFEIVRINGCLNEKNPLLDYCTMYIYWRTVLSIHI